LTADERGQRARGISGLSCEGSWLRSTGFVISASLPFRRGIVLNGSPVHGKDSTAFASTSSIDSVLAGRPDTALRLAQVTGMSADFWLGLQSDWDLWHALRSDDAKQIAKLEPLPRAG
jgi:hypothetical protein